MRRLIIAADLADERADAFGGAEVVLAIPTMFADYMAFHGDAQGVFQSFELIPGALAKIGDPATSPAELAEGINNLAGLIGYMRAAHGRNMSFLGRIEALVGAVTM